MWRLFGKLLYAGSLIVTLPILGLGVFALIGMSDSLHFSMAALVFAGWVAGGVLGVAGLILNGSGHSSHSRLAVVTTMSCLIAGIVTCGSIAIVLAYELHVLWAAFPFAVLSAVGIFKSIILLRKDKRHVETFARPSSESTSIQPPSIAPSDRSGADPAPVFFLGLACLLAAVVIAMHLVQAV